MKRANMLIVTALMAGCLMASPNMNIEQKKDKAIKGYTAALQSNNTGLKCDVLHKIAQLKCECPGTDVAGFVPALKKMSINDQNVMIRLRAQLTLAYIQNDALATCVKTQRAEPAEVFFSRLFQEVTKVADGSY